MGDRKPLEYYLNQGYDILITEEVEGGYVVEVLGLPGCIAQGETLEEALEAIDEARQLWLETAHEEGDDIL